MQPAVALTDAGTSGSIRRYGGYDLTPYERIVRLDAEGSTRLADALEGLPFVLSPGIGDVKHLATTDQIVRIVCQIPELFPEGPRCQAAIKR